ncbi:citrate/2-methylcitrate synthase [Caballeronia sp. 15711]|uniref:citrate/2-methylcitrate synthase n=1 Tax=Caballeronia sp. 15711 TaxID=3391029 RepID=UPI0039E34BFC
MFTTSGVADSAVQALTGRQPVISVALVALYRSLQLPRGTAAAIFVLGRSIGRIAHAVEQRYQETLIRPWRICLLSCGDH